MEGKRQEELCASVPSAGRKQCVSVYGRASKFRLHNHSILFTIIFGVILLFFLFGEGEGINE
jgi:hypothetical protein